LKLPIVHPVHLVSLSNYLPNGFANSNCAT
jgi:hypothetical protein